MSEKYHNLLAQNTIPVVPMIDMPSSSCVFCHYQR